MGPIVAVGTGTAAGATSGGGTERMKTAAQELEGVFIGLLMKAMRSTVSQGGLFKGGADTESYRDLFDQEIGRSLAKSGGIGLAAMILRDQTLRQAADRVSGAAGGSGVPVEEQPEEKGSPSGDRLPIHPTVR